MTIKAPLIPKTKSDLAGLDALIRGSQGDKAIRKEAEPTASADSSLPSTTDETTLAHDEIRQTTGSVSDDKLERLQVTIWRSVIIAAKIEAVRRNTSTAGIIELALRQYLNLPPKT